MKVLLVEDQEQMTLAIEQVLKKNKMVVDIALDGEIGLYNALNYVYDVIILDVMLPFVDGFTILKKIREEKITTPILMLTAKSEVSDKVQGLDLGADDYLAKPFDTIELVARVRALGRRSVLVDNSLEYNGVSLNPDLMKLEYGNVFFDLTLKEFQILEMFFKKPGNVVAKEVIINKLWSNDKVVIDNNVEVYISFLRKKLEILNAGVRIITVRGVGYKLVGGEDV